MRAHAIAAAFLLITAGCTGGAPDMRVDPVILVERAALDRWTRGDAQGFLDLYTPETSSFDPGVRQITMDRYEMLNPKVQHHDEVAVLTFNLVNYGRQADGTEVVVNRWNVTEVYHRRGRTWRIIHSHWSRA
jgi:hypothetical protein